MPHGSAARALVVVVDDDLSMREYLPLLLREFGFDAEVFASAQGFLESGLLERVDCLLLDVAMPGMSGLELQKVLARGPRAIPIVFITGEANDTVRARVFAAGAVDCLFKPFADTALRRAVNAALRAG
ncbi:MAG: hypothetical protein JWL61_2385 [Gemmatimonadetes bacterium]|nr:hypothetical protein [Gemmatimonadota bacterium]